MTHFFNKSTRNVGKIKNNNKTKKMNKLLQLKILQIFDYLKIKQVDKELSMEPAKCNNRDERK
ncbi:hypothetical protein BpHYR1_030591 [Brachionus plicatilis]|uniref:Uncharacterized protein n=1 Tax=Brachionus plicatilis TaxID=10195 RepID=A0A3M7RFG2_BRAPC|nr:hypothetical protein BpHYR1_030591 [Brachionus plicatilis]